MKILIDINHPAHVHYFKNLIKIMKKNGHEFLIISRDKEIEHYLLNVSKIPFISRGSGSGNLYGKTMYFFKAIFFIFRKAHSFKPEIIISFGTPYPAIVSKLLGIDHISFNDTEHAKLHRVLTNPFSSYILTPYCYYEDFGKKQIKFNSFMELCYLHSNYFFPNPNIFNLLKIPEKRDFVLIRFVSWSAYHDRGQGGIDMEYKRALIKRLKKHVKVFISSEGELPDEFKKDQIDIPPEKIHDVLAHAKLFVGESGTMASECAVLGTPAIYVNSLPLMGYLKEEQDKGLLFHFSNSEGVLEKALELIESPNHKDDYNKISKLMLADKIDLTAFMVWFIENYPESASIMKENSEYQNRFL